ncbi:MAG: rhodanese-like domain-containing protein, partial [Lachnospiraceae bacterium]|nr:rhodanese-like domain-containing protein [Lachnospiraceae bacterium]
AICIPHEQITEQAPNVIPDKNTVIYVYCRSGRRSKIAAQALADAGYVNVTEIGGILDYTGELEMN